MTKQMTNVAMMMVLAMGLMASAIMAQKDNGGFAPVGIYTGIETAEGTSDKAGGAVYGNTFVLTSHGEWETHQLTISLDYQVGIVPNSFVVSGGSWSLTVFRDNKFAGSLSGQIESGLIVIGTNADGEDASKQVSVNLMSNRGSGMFDAKDRKDISGSYNAITDMRSRERETNGSLSMPF